MTSTFLVAVELSDTSPPSLDGMRELIQESLEADGIPVTSVAPWARPTSTDTPLSPGPLDQATTLF